MEPVQGESNPLKLSSYKYEHKHVGYHFASFFMGIWFRFLDFESTRIISVNLQKMWKKEGRPAKSAILRQYYQTNIDSSTMGKISTNVALKK